MPENQPHTRFFARFICGFSALLILHSAQLRAQCSLGLYATNAALNCLTSSTSATVNVVSGGTPPYTYNWLPTGGTSSVAVNLTPNTYTITVMDAMGCVGSTMLIILNNTGVNVFMNPTPVSCFNGANGQITANVVGTTNYPLSYSWTPAAPNASVITGLTAGAYSVLVTDAMGCTYNGSATLTQPPAINTTVTTKPIYCYGAMSGATISVTGGTTPYSYAWAPVTNTTTAANNIPAGNYSVTVTDANACSYVSTFTISQPAQLSPTISTTSITCNGAANGTASLSISGGIPAYTYTWLPVNSYATSIASLTPGSYTLLAKDSKSCSVTQTFAIVQPLVLTYTSAHTDEFCINADGTATLNVNGGTGPYTYSWTAPGSPTTNVATNLATGTYSAFISDVNSCTVTAFVTIGNLSNMIAHITGKTDVTCHGSCNGTATASISGGSAPYTYNWLSVPSGTAASVTGLCAGTYTVKITDNTGCYAYTSVNITEPSVLNYTITGTPRICTGQSATLSVNPSGGLAPYTYTWQPGTINTSTAVVSPLSTTSFSLNVGDASGCVGPVKVFQVVVDPPLSINLTAGSLSVCPNVNAAVSVSVAGGDGNYVYSWMPGSVSTQSITVNIQSSTVFTLTVSDGCGSAPVTSSVNVTVFPTQVPTFNSTATEGCEPVCIQFTNTTPSVTSVYWAFGDFGAAVNSPVATHCYEKAGKYTLNLITTDPKGCHSSLILPDYITVFPKPKADFVYTPSQIDLNSPDVEFKNSSVDASQVTWVLDGLLLSKKQTVEHTFFDEGCYDLKLIASNDDLCSDTTDRQVCVNIGFNFYMPDAFTPNGDKHNETFIPKGTDWKPDNYSFSIMDRWGLIVFKTSDPNAGWNGRMGSTDATDDIYIWQVTVTDLYGYEHSFNGKVMLIR